jgi:hypothetical protein
VFENRAQRRIFGHNWDKRKEDQTKLHNEELHKIALKRSYRDGMGETCSAHEGNEK